MKDLKDKVVVITGAGSGIGRSVALAFAREGARLHLSDINQGNVETVAKEARALGAEAASYAVDSSDRRAVEKFAGDVFAAAGRVDILHNNAGIGSGGDIDKITLESWEKILSINLWGVIFGVHYFLPKMIAQGGGGHIINTASSAGLIGLPNQASYVASKFAVVGISEVMSMELRKHGIYTTVLCPGMIRTNIHRVGVYEFADDTKAIRDLATEMFEKHGASPDKVASDLLKAVRKRKPICVSPAWQVYLGWIVKRISPGLYQNLMRMIVDRLFPRKI